MPASGSVELPDAADAGGGVRAVHVPYSAVRSVELVVPVSRSGLGAFRIALAS